MEECYSELRARWLAGERDRELALRLMYFAWMHWADPPFVTGMADDPMAADLWHETFAHLGGENSTDAEYLYVSGIMAELFPWALGDEIEWKQRGLRMQARAKEVQPAGLSIAVFDDRGEYGKYFAHHLRGGHTLTVEAQVKPPIWRVALAFLLAPAAAALVYACFMPLYAGLPDLADRVWRTFLIYLLVGGYPAAIVLGIPVFLALKSRLKLTPLSCALVGAAIAVAPWLLLGLLPGPHYAYSNGHVTHENGMTTLWGWFDLGVFSLQIAALGFLAGLVFWAVAALGLRGGR